MTRYEKEKILLMALGLCEGEKITLTDYHVTCKIKYDEEANNFKLIPIDNKLVTGWLYITDLIKYNFKKVSTLGSKTCRDMDCEKCPFWENVTCQGGLDAKLYEVLEISNKQFPIDKETYEQIKKELDKDVENAKED